MSEPSLTDFSKSVAAMKPLLSLLSLPVLVLSLAVGGGAALAQPVAQTPLSSPLEVSGSVNTHQASSCGFLSQPAAQVLQVNQDFVSLDIAVTGSPGLTLLIQGTGGFSECHSASGSSGTINAPGLLNRDTYSFYIGNTNLTQTSYTLRLTQN